MDLRASQEEDQHDELFVCQDISSRVERNRLSRERSSLLAIFSFLGPRVILDLARLSGVGCVRETGWGQECCSTLEACLCVRIQGGRRLPRNPNLFLLYFLQSYI
jgi:hypothetical protein